MNSFWAELANYSVRAFWQVPLLAGAGWGACRLVRPLGPEKEHRVWVTTLLAAVVLPMLPAFHSVWPALLAGDTAGAGRVTLHTVGVRGAGTTAWAVPADLLRLVTLLYLGSVMFFGLRLLRSVVRTFALRRRVTEVELNAASKQLWDCCRRTFQVGEVAILRSAEIAGPTTVSLRGHVILLPAHLADSQDGQEFLTALAHESAHVQRGDFRKNLFYELVSLPIAFHPVTWLIKAGVEQSREMLCDALVVRSLVAPQVYVRALLRLAAAVPCLPGIPTNAIGILDANILERRVMTIRDGSKPVSGTKRKALTVAGVACLLGAAGGGAMAAVALVPSVGAADSKTPRVYEVGKDVSAPKLIHDASPGFPEAVRKQKKAFDGMCTVALIVDERGIPRDIHVTRSLGTEFDRNAMIAVSQYRFQPARHHDSPVPVALYVDVHFQQFE